MGAELIVDAIPKIEAGLITPVRQEDENSSYAKMLQKSMGKIDWERPAVQIERLVRGLNSWPSAYTSYHGKILKIWESSLVHGCENGTSEAGEVVSVEKDALFVQTGEGILKVTQVQLEGKKRMPVKDFLLGYQMQAGERFS